MKYFLYALCLALIILKLTNFIDYSWWIVFMPLYGGLIIWIFLLLLLGVLKVLNNRKMNVNSFMRNRKHKSRFQEKLDYYMYSQHKAKIK